MCTAFMWNNFHGRGSNPMDKWRITLCSWLEGHLICGLFFFRLTASQGPQLEDNICKVLLCCKQVLCVFLYECERTCVSTGVWPSCQSSMTCQIQNRPAFLKWTRVMWKFFAMAKWTITSCSESTTKTLWPYDSLFIFLSLDSFP